jgi:hypothetical protein
MSSEKNKPTVIILVSTGLVLLVLFFIFSPQIFSDHYSSASNLSPAALIVSTSTPKTTPRAIPSYVSTPEAVKGIYMTSWVASADKYRQPLVTLIDETELNTLVIDIKDYSGKIVFPVTSPELKSHGSEEIRIKDLPQFIESLHQKGIYVIGRIAVFQDAYFVKHRPDLAVKNKAGTAVWKDRKGISWIDPGSREYWEYIALLSKESWEIGFDEINFDYIRFPSDGNMQDISYPFSSTTPKTLVLKNFFEYLDNKLSDSDLTTSADLFGMVTTATDDMGIGQLLENALPYFDYISPMVYPSHYPTTFMGYKLPEAYPYEVVQFAMNSAVNRAEALASTTGQTISEYKDKLRPWLQDFGLKVEYGSPEVLAQIKATYDVGLDSWLLWSASNRYTQGALKRE